METDLSWRTVGVAPYSSALINSRNSTAERSLDALWADETGRPAEVERGIAQFPKDLRHTDRRWAVFGLLAPGIMVKRLVAAAALVLLVTSRAQAAPFTFVFTTDYFEPLAGPPETGFFITFVESDTNRRKEPFKTVTVLATRGVSGLLPGVTETTISFEAASLDNVYFYADGGYRCCEPSTNLISSIYFAQLPPEQGRISAFDVATYGDPWISLAALGDGFSGDWELVFGAFQRGPIGTWSLAPAAPTPVPEPASLLLMGTGLAAVAAKKYRLVGFMSRSRN